jgi:hypothetical protein
VALVGDRAVPQGPRAARGKRPRPTASPRSRGQTLVCHLVMCWPGF